LAVARDLTDKHVTAEVWRLLSAVNANMQRWDEALADLEIALQHDPESVPPRLRRALLREQRGDALGALAALEVLASKHPDSPELLVQPGRALQYAGESGRAETGITVRYSAGQPTHRCTGC